MRRLLALALVLVLSGCGSATTPTGPAQSTSGAQATAAALATGPSSTSPAGQPTAASGAAIPAACAAGFTDYLKLIEPVVAGFDPATARYGAFFDADEAANETGIDAMMANGAKATYSCPEVGLEFNYFDFHSPWAAILALAAAQAPGTLGYLQVKQKVAAIDTSEMADYGVASCDAAVARIKKDVKDDTAAGKATLADLSVDAGLKLDGLFNAYMNDVQDLACPADVLDNTQIDFMQEQ